MAIMNILEVFKETQASITSDLKALLDERRSIIVVGAGNLGKKIASFLIKKGFNFYSFTDNNPKRWGEKIGDKKIFSPSKLSHELKERAIWIVSIWSPGHSYATTKNQLQNLEVANIFHAAALMQLFPEDLLPHYHFQTASYFIGHKDQITEVYENLADEESKKQFYDHINCRIHLNFEGLPVADTANQYFPSDIVTLSNKEVFLDGGAYDGDTLSEFTNRTGENFSKYLALEPDPANYKKLERIAASFNKGKVEVFQLAVGAENTILKFDATGGAGAGFSDAGGIEVESKTIDDYFYEYKPTYIKLDIEGAELDALKGAAKTINTYKPKLAVCIYHLPNDLWEIFLYLKKQYPFYNFFTRTHQYDGLDFVLYAIPK
jgi:FkbM family methyltransferase